MTTTEQARRRNASGFTLVELLVVIVIITALAAIIVPAVYLVLGRAKQSRIGIDVANLVQGLERYKAEFGEYPPDFSSAAIQTDPQDRRNEARRLIDEHLSSIFRRRALKSQPNDLQYDMARQVTNNPPPPAPTPVDESILDVLDPSTALVFWLQGFSQDPQYPISGGGERSPLTNFDKGRFANAINLLTRDRQPRTYAAQYHPNDGGENKPYLYYNANSYTSSTAVVDPNVLPAVNWANTLGVSPPYVSSILANNFVDPEKYQIISAGMDGAYGTVKVPVGVSPQDAIRDIRNYPSVPDGKNCDEFHRDNLTSFSGGVIADMISK